MSAVTSPPAPLRIVPRGPGSIGARLLTMIGDHGARTREVYSPIEFSLGLDKGAQESYIPAIRKIHAAAATAAHGGGIACCEKRFERFSAPTKSRDSVTARCP